MSLDQDLIRLTNTVNEFVDEVYSLHVERFKIVAESENSATLNGFTPTEIKNQLMDLVQSHVNVKGQNVHGVTSDEIGTMSRDEIYSYFNQYLQEYSQLPISSVGDSSAINPLIRNHRDVATHEDFINTGAFMHMDGLGNLSIIRNMKGCASFALFVTKLNDARLSPIVQTKATNTRITPLGKYGQFITGVDSSDSFTMMHCDYFEKFKNFGTRINEFGQTVANNDCPMAKMNIGESSLNTLESFNILELSGSGYSPVLSPGDKNLPKFGLEFTIGNLVITVGRKVDNNGTISRNYGSKPALGKTGYKSEWYEYDQENTMNVQEPVYYSEERVGGLACLIYNKVTKVGGTPLDWKWKVGGVMESSLNYATHSNYGQRYGETPFAKSTLFSNIDANIVCKEDRCNAHQIMIRDTSSTNKFYLYTRIRAHHEYMSLDPIYFYTKLKVTVGPTGDLDFSEYLDILPSVIRDGNTLKLVENDSRVVFGDPLLDLFNFPGCHDLLVENGVAFLLTTDRDSEKSFLRRITFNGTKADFYNGTHTVTDDVTTRIVNPYNNHVTDDIRCISFKFIGRNTNSFMNMGVNPLNGDKEIDLIEVVPNTTQGRTWIKEAHKLHDGIGFQSHFDEYGIKYFENLVTAPSEYYTRDSFTLWRLFEYGTSYVNTFKISAPLGVIPSNHPPVYREIKLSKPIATNKLNVELIGKTPISSLFTNNVYGKIVSTLPVGNLGHSYEILPFGKNPIAGTDIDSVMFLFYIINRNNRFYVVSKVAGCKVLIRGGEISDISLAPQIHFPTLTKPWATVGEIEIDEGSFTTGVYTGGNMIEKRFYVADDSGDGWSSGRWSNGYDTCVRTTANVLINGRPRKLNVQTTWESRAVSGVPGDDAVIGALKLFDSSADDLDVIGSNHRHSKTFSTIVAESAKYGWTQTGSPAAKPLRNITVLNLQGGDNEYSGYPHIGGIAPIGFDINWFAGTIYETYRRDPNDAMQFIDRNSHDDIFAKRAITFDGIHVILNGNYVKVPPVTVIKEEDNLLVGGSDRGNLYIVGFWIVNDKPNDWTNELSVKTITQPYVSSEVMWYEYPLSQIHAKDNIYLGYVAMDKYGRIIKNTLGTLFQVDGAGLSGYPKGNSIPYSSPTATESKELWWS